jgi:hypothetical protein
MGFAMFSQSYELRADMHFEQPFVLGSSRFQLLKVLCWPVYEDTVFYGGYDATGLVERKDGNFTGAVN